MCGKPHASISVSQQSTENYFSLSYVLVGKSPSDECLIWSRTLKIRPGANCTRLNAIGSLAGANQVALTVRSTSNGECNSEQTLARNSKLGSRPGVSELINTGMIFKQMS